MYFIPWGDAANKILVWSLTSGTPMIHLSEWGFHTARIASLEWLPGHFVWTSRTPDFADHDQLIRSRSIMEALEILGGDNMR